VRDEDLLRFPIGRQRRRRLGSGRLVGLVLWLHVDSVGGVQIKRVLGLLIVIDVRRRCPREIDVLRATLHRPDQSGGLSVGEDELHALVGALGRNARAPGEELLERCGAGDLLVTES
jgi:hypothetical protein